MSQAHAHAHAPTGAEAAALDGEGPPTVLYHHFDDLEQQHESSMLGMWAFLATEVLFFGGLILAYTVYRNLYTPSFHAASHFLNVALGGLNTGILLTSSLTMALAVRSAQLRQYTPLVRYLLATMALGTAFLGVKAIEWYRDYEEHLIPGINFDWEKANRGHGGHDSSGDPGASGRPGQPAPGPREHQGTADVGPGAGKSVDPSASMARVQDVREAEAVLPLNPAPGDVLGEVPAATFAARAQLFFVLYFCLTGLHALHMIIGIAILGVLAYLAHRRWLSGGGATQVEAVGLYWHFVDIVWIYLYPILYLFDAR